MAVFVPQTRDYGVASEELLWWQACRLQLTNARHGCLYSH